MLSCLPAQRRMPVRKCMIILTALLLLVLCGCGHGKYQEEEPQGTACVLHVPPKYEYNEAGRLIRQTEFNMDGSPACEILYQYNDNGTCARYDHYNMVGELLQESIYEWDGDTYTLHITYHQNGVKTAFHKCGYDAKGRVIRREVYDAADVLQYTDLLEYNDGKDWLKKKTHRKSDGTYSVTNYDRWGQFIEETWYRADGRLLFEE